MFKSKAEKILLFLIIFLVIAIPIVSYVISIRFKADTEGSTQGESSRAVSFSPGPVEVPPTSPLTELKNNLEAQSSPKPNTSTTPNVQVNLGPTLSFKANLEGRPSDNQAGKVFVGIASGQPTGAPQYLLSFLVDVPANGMFSNLSLAGLSIGSTYTAYLKGPSQIATSSAFILKPTATDLGQVTMLSGDLNDDNVINNADAGIIRPILGARPNSTNWNPKADINADNVINNFDLGFITKNTGKVGASGAWTVQPQVSTPSAEMIHSAPSEHSGQFIGGPESPGDKSGGYWMWVPKIE